MATSGGGGGNSGAIRAGAAFVEVSGKDKGLKAFLDGIPKQFKAMGAKLSSIGLGGAAIGGAIVAPLAGLANHFIDAGSKATDMAARLNTSTETVTALGYAAELAGGSMEDVEANIGKLRLNIAKGAEDGDPFFQGLIGKDVDTQLAAVADRIAGITDETLQQKAAFDFFGKSGKKMLPFLKDGAAGLAALREQAGQDGAIIGSDEADKADRIGDAISRVVTNVTSIGRAIGGAMLPDAGEAEAFAKSIAGAGQQVRGFIRENAEVFTIVGLVGTGLVVAGGAVATFGGVMIGTVAAVTAVTAVLSAVLSPLGLLAIGVAALTAGLALCIAETDTFGETWAGVKDALAAGDLKIAAETAFAGVSIAWQHAINEMTIAWRNFNELITFDPAKSKTAGNLDVVGTMKPSESFGFLSDVFRREVLGENVAERAVRPEVDQAIRDQNARDRAIDANRAERDKDLDKELAKKEASLKDLRDRAAQAKADREAAEEWEAARKANLRGLIKDTPATNGALAETVRGMFANASLGSALNVSDGRDVKGLLERSAEANEEVAAAIKDAPPFVWSA